MNKNKIRYQRKYRLHDPFKDYGIATCLNWELPDNFTCSTYFSSNQRPFNQDPLESKRIYRRESLSLLKISNHQ